MTNLSELGNQQQIEDLRWAIESSMGEFKLILARCNYLNLQYKIIAELQKKCEIEIQILQLQKSTKTLYHAVQAGFEPENQALMIVRWETLPNLSQMFIAANQVREEFRKNCQYPIVWWINDQVYQQMMESATDLESWGITINFTLPVQELIYLMELSTDKILNDDFNVEVDVNLQELELGLQDSQKYLPKITANLATTFKFYGSFLQGFIANHKNNLDAIKYYKRSLDFWANTENIEIQGKILYYLTFCKFYKLKPSPKEIINDIHKIIELFKNAQRFDLIANSLAGLGCILEELEEWTELQTLAEQAVDIHESENKSNNTILKIAQDYVFLAKAILGQSNFKEAEKTANQGLKILEKLNNSKYHSDKYQEYRVNLYFFHRQKLLFILVQAKQKLQKYQLAIDNLKLAQALGVINKYPQLYIEVLTLLQELLYNQKDYPTALKTKLERLSIEKQFGLRAFVGLSMIKAAKSPSVNLHFPHKQVNIAPEIIASGRNIDVDNLLELIGRNDKKIIIIHGHSGVGKSSLINAGLVPALKNKSIGGQDNLPVTMRVYQDWLAELNKQLFKVLPASLKSGFAEIKTPAYLILQLIKIENNNIRTILVFDQFEEFFFLYPDRNSQIKFFHFLGECLKISSLRIILSMQIDYLHLLLECNELESMKIISQDILSKNILYKLGDLKVEQARLTIQKLTKNTTFNLEPDLINQLLRDLAGEEDVASESGTIRPIELQIVGAQLETDKITTLAKYQVTGNKQELIKRYLDTIIADCGQEYQEIAELLLYFLTDKKGTRPLRTREDLEQDLQSLITNIQDQKKHLDLVLAIFIKFGLVILLPEQPAQRYQLVHDYVATFIRQRQEPLIQQLAKEKERRKITELKLKSFLQQL